MSGARIRSTMLAIRIGLPALLAGMLLFWPACGGRPRPGAPIEDCGGKRCGEPCTLCVPYGDREPCPEVQVCDRGGNCVAGPVSCGYEPCANKACGDACTICPPGEPGCVETAVVKQCNGAGACEPAPAQCPADAGAPDAAMGTDAGPAGPL